MAGYYEEFPSVGGVLGGSAANSINKVEPHLTDLIARLEQITSRAQLASIGVHTIADTLHGSETVSETVACPPKESNSLASAINAVDRAVSGIERALARI